jgi:ribosomal protein S9
VASLPRRTAAGAIDLLVMGGGLVGVAGAIGLATAKWLQTGSERISRALGQPGTERARVRQLAANDEIERLAGTVVIDDR